ncbi:MAG: hypothetical protein ACK4E8_10755 [Lacibacter sp.]|jgi:hypothetical protein
MRAKLSYLFLTLLLLTACKKDNFDTRPRLELRDFRVFQVTTPSGSGTLIEIEFNALDKEGDVKDSIFIDKLDAGSIPCPANNLTGLKYRIPDFPGNRQRTLLRLQFSVNVQLDGYVLLNGPQCPGRADTSTFRFWVKDLAGNISDTLVTPRAFIPR